MPTHIICVCPYQICPNELSLQYPAVRDTNLTAVTVRNVIQTNYVWRNVSKCDLYCADILWIRIVCHCIWCVCFTDVTNACSDATCSTAIASVHSRPIHQLQLAHQLALLTITNTHLSPERALQTASKQTRICTKDIADLVIASGIGIPGGSTSG